MNVMMQSFTMSFDNGWTVDVAELICGHYDVGVLPSRFKESVNEAEKEMSSNRNHWTDAAMIKRGDLIRHFDKSDDELLDFIVAVRSRPMEPHLAEINARIKATCRD